MGQLKSGVIACRQDEEQQTDDDKEWDITALKHGDLRESEYLH